MFVFARTASLQALRPTHNCVCCGALNTTLALIYFFTCISFSSLFLLKKLIFCNQLQCLLFIQGGPKK